MSLNYVVDETDGGSKNSSPKPFKKQESAPAGVLNVSILYITEMQLGLVYMKSWECIFHPSPHPQALSAFIVIYVEKLWSSFCLLQLKAYDQAAVIAGYVMSQEGKKFNRVWYQVRQDCVLYKFRAHEVSEGKKRKEGEEKRSVHFVDVYLIAGYQGIPCSTSTWICSHISKC